MSESKPNAADRPSTLHSQDAANSAETRAAAIPLWFVREVPDGNVPECCWCGPAGHGGIHHGKNPLENDGKRMFWRCGNCGGRMRFVVVGSDAAFAGDEKVLWMPDESPLANVAQAIDREHFKCDGCLDQKPISEMTVVRNRHGHALPVLCVECAEDMKNDLPIVVRQPRGLSRMHLATMDVRTPFRLDSSLVAKPPAELVSAVGDAIRRETDACTKALLAAEDTQPVDGVAGKPVFKRVDFALYTHKRPKDGRDCDYMAHAACNKCGWVESKKDAP